MGTSSSTGEVGDESCHLENMIPFFRTLQSLRRAAWSLQLIVTFFVCHRYLTVVGLDSDRRMRSV